MSTIYASLSHFPTWEIRNVDQLKHMSTCGMHDTEYTLSHVPTCLIYVNNIVPPDLSHVPTCEIRDADHLKPHFHM